MRQAAVAETFVPQTAPLEVVLPHAARRIIDFFLTEFGRPVLRSCVEDSGRFPEPGQKSCDSGPALIRKRLASCLNGAVARDALAIDNIHLAADQFAELCKADLFPSIPCGLTREFSKAALNRIADGAVSMFLARCGIEMPQSTRRT